MRFRGGLLQQVEKGRHLAFASLSLLFVLSVCEQLSCGAAHRKARVSDYHANLAQVTIDHEVEVHGQTEVERRGFDARAVGVGS